VASAAPLLQPLERMSAEPPAAPPASYVQRLLYRWFVEYNPLYLVSAVLVLGGGFAMSRELSGRPGVAGPLGVAAISEVYALALIGGAALLKRLELRRPAVMLAVLAALYQGDLTLHTEACVYMGVLGLVASAVWAALFAVKLAGLAWAMGLRLSRSALVVPSLSAAGMAALPHLFDTRDAARTTALVVVWVFGVAAAAAWAPRRVESRVELSPWQALVFARALRVTWTLWAVLASLHVLFWSTAYPVQLSALLPVPMLVATSRMRRERSVWLAVAASLALSAVAAPGSFYLAAAMACATLALRAHRAPRWSHVHVAAESAAVGPYRVDDSELAAPVEPRPEPDLSFGPEEPAARARLATGALASAYLAAWTLGWTGGPWPDHLLALDLALTGLVALLFVRRRARAPLAPLAATALHAGWRAHLVPAPVTALGWGALSVSLGFTLLVGSLAAAWYLRRHAPRLSSTS
jgi:hypothetical protein